MVKSDTIKQLELADKLVKKFDEVITDEDALADVLTGLVDAFKPLSKHNEEVEVKYGELCAIVEGIIEYSSGFASKTSTSEKQLQKLKKSLNAIVKIKDYILCSFNYEVVEEDFGPSRLIGSDNKDALDQQPTSSTE